MFINRRKTKVIKIGSLYIGGNNPVAIQSMIKYKTSDIKNSLLQIKQLENCGCEIVRLAIKDSADAKALRQLKRYIKIPLVCDIHFNWNLALEAIENGADKIRLNPGNIYKKSQIREIVAALKAARIPLRIGLNSGSVRDQGRKKISLADKLVASALDYVRIVEKFKFSDIVVSLKASTVLDTIEAYRKFSKLRSYPLHLGVTATGLPTDGAIMSSIAIGALLLDGIGDTIRISLTDIPQEEVRVAKATLEAIGLRVFGPKIISCPTCGRCEVNLVKLIKELEAAITAQSVNSQMVRKAHYSLDYPQRSRGVLKPLKVAVMGCIVNGPQEARAADIGIAFGKNKGLLFKKGKPIRKISSVNCVEILLKELKGTNV